MGPCSRMPRRSFRQSAESSNALLAAESLVVAEQSHSNMFVRQTKAVELSICENCWICVRTKSITEHVCVCVIHAPAELCFSRATHAGISILHSVPYLHGLLKLRLHPALKPVPLLCRFDPLLCTRPRLRYMASLSVENYSYRGSVVFAPQQMVYA